MTNLNTFHASDALNAVDPFIGVDGWGNCLCGPYLPFSLVRLGPDTCPPQPTNGYTSGTNIVRFSHTHVSGTGGGGRYGNIGVIPFLEKSADGIQASRLGYAHADEVARPGYYATTLLPAAIRAELTVTPRTGIHRYTFPRQCDYPSESTPGVLIDVGAVIVCDVASNEVAESYGGYVEWVSETELVGRADLRGGWGHQHPYSVFFSAQFDIAPHQRLVAHGDLLMADQTFVEGPHCLGIALFDPEAEPNDMPLVINLRVGISYVSIANARGSIDREATGRDFEHIHAEAQMIWNQALAPLQVEGGTAEQRQLFYTLFTRLLCMPTDLGVDDENHLWKSGTRHFTDIYCLWDSVRCANSLLLLIAPDFTIALLNALLDIAAHIGWFPDAWIAGHSAMLQGGSSADILFCEAALKGLPGVDYQRALRYMRKNAETTSPDPRFWGRYGQDYRSLGYVSADEVPNASVSRHLEYAYQDWCIGKLAAVLGQRSLSDTYYQNSRKIWNLWRDDLHSFAPKSHAGSWIEPFDPTRYHHAQRWNDPFFYEGTGRQWSFNTQHDFAGLIERFGGPESFIFALDRFFATGQYDPKETLVHVPYLYHYAGRPDKTAERVHECLARYFHPTRDGLADNEDMGCQSAWYMWSTLGLYPMMGQDLYLLSSPCFKHVEMTLGTSTKKLVIEAPEANSENIYVQAVTLNGTPLPRAWVRHQELASGAVLRFTLGSVPSSWGQETPPPSPLHSTL